MKYVDDEEKSVVRTPLPLTDFSGSTHGNIITVGTTNSNGGLI